MTLVFAALVCFGVGYTAYRVGVSTGWREAGEYFDARQAWLQSRAQNEPEGSE